MHEPVAAGMQRVPQGALPLGGPQPRQPPHHRVVCHLAQAARLIPLQLLPAPAPQHSHLSQPCLDDMMQQVVQLQSLTWLAIQKPFCMRRIKPQLLTMVSSGLIHALIPDQTMIQPCKQITVPSNNPLRPGPSAPCKQVKKP